MGSAKWRTIGIAIGVLMMSAGLLWAVYSYTMKHPVGGIPYPKRVFTAEEREYIKAMTSRQGEVQKEAPIISYLDEPDTPIWGIKIEPCDDGDTIVLRVPPYFIYLDYGGDVRWGWVPVEDEPDTDRLVMSGAASNECDDPTHDVSFGTIELSTDMTWTVGQGEITIKVESETYRIEEINFGDIYDTSIMINLDNGIDWDVYRDSAGVHIKVFRKEAGE